MSRCPGKKAEPDLLDMKDCSLATPQAEIDYLLKREIQERAAADATTDQSARHVHITLAEHYAKRARGSALRLDGSLTGVAASTRGMDEKQMRFLRPRARASDDTDVR